MKLKSLVIASLATIASTAAFADSTATPSDASARFEAPVPVKVVQPVLLPEHHASSELTLTMTIDETGKPRNVEVASKVDQEAYKRLRATVAQWRFTPARKNGAAVSARVVLPIEITGL